MPSGIFIGQCVAVVCRVLSKRLQSSWTAACSHARCRPDAEFRRNLFFTDYTRDVSALDPTLFAVTPGRQAAAEARAPTTQTPITLNVILARKGLSLPTHLVPDH